MIGNQPDRIRNRCCWSCERWHSGHVWCPHCSAPVDPGSLEARMSPFWERDPRRGAIAGQHLQPATQEGLPVSDLGQSPRVKLLAANIRASMRDYDGEHRIRLNGLDRGDLEAFIDTVRNGGGDILIDWYSDGRLTNGEFVELANLRTDREEELKT